MPDSDSDKEEIVLLTGTDQSRYAFARDPPPVTAAAKERDELKAFVAELKSDLEMRKALTETADKAFSEQIVYLETKNNELTQHMTALRHENNELTQHMTALRRENNELTQHMTALRLKHDNLDCYNKYLQSTNFTITQRLNSLEQEKMNVKAYVSPIIASNKNYGRQLFEFNQRFIEIRQQLHMTEQINQRFAKTLRQREHEMAVLSEKNQKYEDEICRLLVQIKGYKEKEEAEKGKSSDQVCELARRIRSFDIFLDENKMSKEFEQFDKGFKDDYQQSLLRQMHQWGRKQRAFDIFVVENGMKEKFDQFEKDYQDDYQQ